MEHTTKAAEGSYNCQSQQTSATPRPTALFFSFLESVGKYWQMGHCETRRANHCCGSASKHCQGPWGTPQRQQKAAATTANHIKHQPYLGQLPPSFHSWRVLANIGNKESQPLLWQCFKTLPRSMGHTTKAAEG